MACRNMRITVKCRQCQSVFRVIHATPIMAHGPMCCIYCGSQHISVSAPIETLYDEIMGEAFGLTPTEFDTMYTLWLTHFKQYNKFSDFWTFIKGQ